MVQYAIICRCITLPPNRAHRSPGYTRTDFMQNNVIVARDTLPLLRRTKRRGHDPQQLPRAVAFVSY